MMTEWLPSYLQLHASGALAARAAAAFDGLAHCRLCPRRCDADRLAGRHGTCRSGAEARVASWNAHHWEEPPLSGTRGSGTIFFSGCTGRCCFCQNYPISQFGYGNTVTPRQISSMMLELQRRDCHNINLVTPTHFVPQILLALDLAAARGLRLPLVYNTSGYESLETIALLDGVVDIWLPDAKYDDDATAQQISGFPDYIRHNRAALRAMFRQVGDTLQLDQTGIAQRGMIVRHLVLPDGLAGTEGVLRWIADELSPRLHISLMDQYFPAFKALDHPQLGRKITAEEYEAALAAFEAAGMEFGWQQEHDDCDI